MQRQRIVIVVGAVVGLVIAAAVVFLVLGDGSDKDGKGTSVTTSTTRPVEIPAIDPSLVAASGFDDPTTGELPDVEDREATVEHLEGPGWALVTFRVEAGALVAEAEVSAAACDQIAARLEGGPAPGDLQELAAATPDQVTADMFANAISGTMSALDGCASGMPDGRASLAWQFAVLDRRLEQLGIA